MPEGEPREEPPLVARMQRWLDTSQVRGFPYTVTILGLEFIVDRGVFSPAYYSETEFFARHVLRRIRRGDRYLDLGCGIGATAVLAARRGATVVALDVNPTAVTNTQRNATRLGVADQVVARVSDVFSALHADEAFDVVYWNVPFTFRDPDTELTMLEEAVFDPGHRKLRTFMGGASPHLRQDGILLLGASPSLGSPPALRRAAKSSGWTLEVIASGREAGHQGAGPRLELLLATPVAGRHDKRGREPSVS